MAYMNPYEQAVIDQSMQTSPVRKQQQNQAAARAVGAGLLADLVRVSNVQRLDVTSWINKLEQRLD